MFFILPNSRFIFVNSFGNDFLAAHVMQTALHIQSRLINHRHMSAILDLEIASLKNQLTPERTKPSQILQQIQQMNSIVRLALMKNDTLLAEKYVNRAFVNCSKMCELPSTDANTAHAKSIMVDVLTNLAAYEQLSNPASAIATYKKALALHQEIVGSDLHYSSWEYYVNLALSQLVIEDHQSSNSIYDLYHKIFTTNTNHFFQKSCVPEGLTNQAVIAALRNSPEEAFTLFEKAFNELPTPSLGAAIIKFNLFCLYDDAAIYRKEAIEIFKTLVDIAAHPLGRFLDIPRPKKPYKLDRSKYSLPLRFSKIGNFYGCIEKLKTKPDIDDTRKLKPWSKLVF